jgi:hypothetical protein
MPFVLASIYDTIHFVRLHEDEGMLYAALTLGGSQVCWKIEYICIYEWWVAYLMNIMTTRGADETGIACKIHLNLVSYL